MPDSETFWVLPATLLLLSVIVSVAERLPVAVGVKVTVIVQLPPAATELPQVLFCPKSPGFVPVNPMLLIVSAAFPVLFKVKVCGLLVVPTIWLE